MVSGRQANAAKTALTVGEPDSGVSDEAATETAAQGHRRKGADAYRGAERIAVGHESLSAGDRRPSCGQGTIYERATHGSPVAQMPNFLITGVDTSGG